MLTSTDLTTHKALGIDPDVLARAQVRRVTDAQARELGIRFGGAGCDLSGIWYPRVDPWTQRVVGGRVRRDHPEVEAGRPKAKYLATYGDRPHLYLSATSAGALEDLSRPLVVVEAEKAALMLASTAPHVCPIAVGGCWGWKGTVGKAEAADGSRVDEKGPSPDLDRIAWQDRDVVVWFDANVSTNPKVQAAEQHLVAELLRRGARVRIARVPADVVTAHPSINGPDDYRAATSPHAVLEVLSEARPTGRAFTRVEEHLTFARLVDLTDVPTDLEVRLRALAETLREADVLRVRFVREAAVQALNAVKVPGAAPLVDAALKVRHVDPPTVVSVVSDDAPWPHAVSGGSVLDELADAIRAHVVLPSASHADAMALWVALAWCEAHVSVLPLLALTSPTKRCGKSTALGLLGSLTPRALPTSSISAAALFRAVEKWKPTLLIDEADTTLPGNDDLRCMLNAGHTRGQASVIRCVGDDQEPTLFSTWCPKVIAMIVDGRSTLPDTVKDRAIVVELRRKTSTDRVVRRQADTERERLSPIRQRCRRWAEDIGPRLRTADPALPAGLHDRACDNWRGMLALAEAAGAAWADRAARAARMLSGGAEDDGDVPIGVLLLRDLEELWPPDAAWLASATILERLHALEDRPWRAFGRTEKPLTGAKLARLLRPFGVAIDKVRDGARSVNAYRWPQVADAIHRYSLSNPPTPSTEAEHQNFADGSRRSWPSEAEQGQAGRSAFNGQTHLRAVGGFRCSALEGSLELPTERMRAATTADEYEEVADVV